MAAARGVEQESYQQLLASLESLVPQQAESLLADLASALFPSGAGTIDQLSWEGKRARAAPSRNGVGEGAEAANADGRLRAAELRYRTLVEQIPAVTFIA